MCFLPVIVETAAFQCQKYYATAVSTTNDVSGTIGICQQIFNQTLMTTTTSFCLMCRNHNPNNVGCYALNQVVSVITW